MLNIIKEDVSSQFGDLCTTLLNFYFFSRIKKNMILKAILHIYVFVNSEKQKKEREKQKQYPHNNTITTIAMEIKWRSS